MRGGERIIERRGFVRVVCGGDVGGVGRIDCIRARSLEIQAGPAGSPH